MLINTKAEINIMIEKTKDQYNLPIWMDLNLWLIFHIGYCQDFIRICKDIEVNIGKVITKRNIFVIDSADHVLIFEILFMIKSQARID